jgi:nucleoside phosphorylase
MSTQVDILIITVTEAEAKAVFEAFGPAGGIPRDVTVDGRLYHDLGVVNGAQIFHAISEMGAGGVGGAHQSAFRAINSLKPSAVLMVGIAFGVDEKKQSIGDVLVSQQLSLYELQRLGEGVILRGDKPHASPRLINFCRSTAFSASSPISYAVRFGLLLTGDKLIDDISYRNQLLKLEPEAIGGEMEGGGLYVACYESKTDWIVIKAICDWADGNKSNPKKREHQALAAKNAATFTLSTIKKAAFKLPTDAERVRDLTEKEKQLLLRLYDFQATCLIRRPAGEPQEVLWVPGYAGDMQWGASNNDDRLSWLYVVRDLHGLGLLDQTSTAKEYKLSNLGEEEAWKLSIARPKKIAVGHAV